MLRREGLEKGVLTPEMCPHKAASSPYSTRVPHAQRISHGATQLKFVLGLDFQGCIQPGQIEDRQIREESRRARG